jgi:hypothetical protein
MATVITIVNYEPKTFIVQATDLVLNKYPYNNKSCCHNGVKFLSNLLFE